MPELPGGHEELIDEETLETLTASGEEGHVWDFGVPAGGREEQTALAEFGAACGALGLLVDYLRKGLDELPTLAILAAVAGVVVNLVLLAAKGQTLGKMVVKTKVTNYEGHKPSWVNLIFVRTMPFLCLSKLPL